MAYQDTHITITNASPDTAPEKDERQRHEVITTAPIGETRIHLHQAVHQLVESPYDSDDIIGWVITEIDTDHNEIVLKEPGPWYKKKLTFEEFLRGDFVPQTAASDNIPLWGY